MQKHPSLIEIKQRLKTYAPISDDEIEELLNKSAIQEYRKGESFLRAEDEAEAVGFVYRGLFKTYCVSVDGQSYIRTFCSENYFVASYAAAIRGTKADMTIEAIEASTVVALKYSYLKSFFSRSSAWQEFARKLAENHYIERETKEYRLLACSALERYELFIKENQHLIGRVSQADIASYIGIAPESLSRALRKN